MKKNYIFTLLITLCLTGVSFGQVLLDENFDFGATAGDLTTLSSGAWVNHSGSTAVLYSPTGLSMTDYPSSAVGGAASVSPSNSEDVNSVFAVQSSGNIYGSALVSLSSVGNGNYFIHFKDSGNNFRARVGAKDDGNGGVLFGIGAKSSTLDYGSSSFSLNTTYLLVFSYNIDSGVANLYVLTSVVAAEPSTAEATQTGDGGTTVLSIGIRQSGGIPAALIDGVRAATNWSDLMANSTASVKNNAIAGFSTYPNPITNNTFTLTSASNEEKSVMIFNLLGKKVLDTRFSGTKSEINVAAINAGIYILKVTEAGKTATKKLVIK